MFESFLADPSKNSVANLASSHKITRARVRAILQLQQHQLDFAVDGTTLYTESHAEGESPLITLDGAVRGSPASEVDRLDELAPQMLLLGDDDDATAAVRALRRERKTKQITRPKVPMRPTINNPDHNVGAAEAKHRYKTAYITLTDKKELKRQRSAELKAKQLGEKVATKKEKGMMIRDHDGSLRWATFNERRHRR